MRSITWLCLAIGLCSLSIDVRAANIFDKLFNRNKDKGPSPAGSAEENLNLSPVILLPGFGGSQLRGRKNRPSVLRSICSRKSDWFTIWPSPRVVTPELVNCWADDVSLVWDPVTKTLSNQPGVEIEVPGWGTVDKMEWMHPLIKIKKTRYFIDIIDMLIAMGLKKNLSIRGAPFDFRYPPASNRKFFVDIKSLIEETYESNQQRKITLIGHSMGAIYALYLLNNAEQGWKDKYIHNFVALGGPWAGSVKTMKGFVNGDAVNLPLIKDIDLRPALRSFPGFASVIPVTGPIWNNSFAFIRDMSKNKNYTLANMKEFFADIGDPVAYEFYLNASVALNNIDQKSPGVPTRCIYGKGMLTPESYKYYGFPQGEPETDFGDGDGTVNYASLQACKLWKDKQRQPVEAVELLNVDHKLMIGDVDVLAKIRNYVQFNPQTV